MMNERIRLLVKQAGFFPEPNWDHTGWHAAGHNDTFEKFAELIVQECTQLLFDESERLYAYSSECDNMSHSDEAETCAEKCMDNIKIIEEHFGVEQ